MNLDPKLRSPCGKVQVARTSATDQGVVQMAYEALDFYDVDRMLTEEEVMLRDMVRDWVDEKVIPNIEDAYNGGYFRRVDS